MSIMYEGKEYLSIREFADYTGFTVETLRHYDRIGVFHPAMYLNRNSCRHRYYLPMQITLIKMIGVLTEMRVPLKRIKELSDTRTPENIQTLFSQKSDKVIGKLRLYQDIFTAIGVFKRLIDTGINVNESELTVCMMPEEHLIMGEPNRICEPGNFYSEFVRFRKTPRVPDLNMSCPVGGYWPDMVDFLVRPFFPARFFSIDPSGHECRESGLYLNGYTRGYYGEMGDLPQRMAEFAKENALRFTGPVYIRCLLDEICIPVPQDYLFEVSAGVAET